MEKLYTPAQVCEMFNIVKSTLLSWEMKGYIPIPDRNHRGDRQYTQSDIKAIGMFVRSHRQRKRFSQIINNRDEDTPKKLKQLIEDNSLSKFLFLNDPVGLVELREHSPLQQSTIHQLVRAAANQYEPTDEIFWDIISLLYESSHPASRLEQKG